MNRRAVFGWAMYDFANSAFTTLVVTFIYATYFTEAIAPDTNTGTTLWSIGVALSSIAVALLSPLAGALADLGGYRKTFLFWMTALGVVATTVLYFPQPGDIAFALTWFIIANFAFEMGLVFYNAFLPDLAPPEKIGRVSGNAWALGYLGGLLCLVLALFLFVLPENPAFGLSKESGAHIRATNLLVAAWFALFSLPTFLLVPRQALARRPDLSTLYFSTFQRLTRTFAEIRRYREIFLLLLARLFYNDGLVTIIAFGAIYAAGTFGFDTQQILLFGIVLNVAAGAGAFAFGFIDDWLGGKRTLLITIVGLFFASLLAVLTPNEGGFWAAGVVVGLLLGPNQSASRSLMGRFVPKEKENEFYGFFAFSGKATAFLGPILLGQLTQIFDSQRAGISVVLVLFLIGGLLLLLVNEEAGLRRVATEPNPPTPGSHGT